MTVKDTLYAAVSRASLTLSSSPVSQSKHRLPGIPDQIDGPISAFSVSTTAGSAFHVTAIASTASIAAAAELPTANAIGSPTCRAHPSARGLKRGR